MSFSNQPFSLSTACFNFRHIHIHQSYLIKNNRQGPVPGTMEEVICRGFNCLLLRSSEKTSFFVSLASSLQVISCQVISCGAMPKPISDLLVRDRFSGGSSFVRITSVLSVQHLVLAFWKEMLLPGYFGQRRDLSVDGTHVHGAPSMCSFCEV